MLSLRNEITGPPDGYPTAVTHDSTAASPADPAPIQAAKRRLEQERAVVMSSAELSECIGADEAAWARFGSHWDDLAPDRYAAELGTRRLRRYGHFLFTAPGGGFRLLPHGVFAQPEASNPLYVERDRHFMPLTDAFAADPLLRRLLDFLGAMATVLDDAPRWSAKVTPFRVLAHAGDHGDPTPEGVHRDGVTLVTSLLVGRDNAVGGTSSVYDANGRRLLSTTLGEPGTMLLGDDRCTRHGVSPIRAVDPARPARRDVLVITFAPGTTATA